MKNVKRFMVIGAMVTMLGSLSVTAYAASSYHTPAEVVAGLTGKTVEAVTTERVETGETYGTIANESGKLEEFQAQMLQMKKENLAEKVNAGLITQERADAIITAIEENQSTCDGTGSTYVGQRMGAGFGSMNGKGQRMHGYGQCSGLCQVE